MGRPKGGVTKTGKQKKIKVKDPNKPKRSTSAYFYFLADCRKEAAKLGNPPKRIAEFTKEASEKWKALTPKERHHLMLQLQQTGRVIPNRWPSTRARQQIPTNPSVHPQHISSSLLTSESGWQEKELSIKTCSRWLVKNGEA